MREDSSRVRLEIAFLDADEGVPHHSLRRRTMSEHGERCSSSPPSRTFGAMWASVCASVRICGWSRRRRLRQPSRSRRTYSPALLVVDEPERDAVAALAKIRAIVIVDDVPHGAAPPGQRVRFLARPFTAEGLLAEVGELLE